MAERATAGVRSREPVAGSAETDQREIARLRRRVAELERELADRDGRVGVMTIGDVVIDRVEGTVTAAARPLVLLSREYELLVMLALSRGELVSRATLEDAIWKRRRKSGTNAVAVHVSRLRARLRGTGLTIVTERERGYRLVVAAAPFESNRS